MSTLGEDLRPTRIVGKNAGYLLITWLIILCCVSFGIANEGRITYVTMGVPIILLFIYVGLSLSLDGAGAGVKAYIGGKNVKREDRSSIFLVLPIVERFASLDRMGHVCSHGTARCLVDCRLSDLLLHRRYLRHHDGLRVALRARCSRIQQLPHHRILRLWLLHHCGICRVCSTWLSRPARGNYDRVSFDLPDLRCSLGRSHSPRYPPRWNSLDPRLLLLSLSSRH